MVGISLVLSIIFLLYWIMCGISIRFYRYVFSNYPDSDPFDRLHGTRLIKYFTIWPITASIVLGAFILGVLFSLRRDR